MKKSLFLIIFFLCFSSSGYAATWEHYHNEKYNFSLEIPTEFKTASYDTPLAISAYTNEKVFLLLRHIAPKQKFSGSNFGEITVAEIESFIKHQRFVSALNNPKFVFFGHDKHMTSMGFPYIWAMFISDTKINEYNFRTYMLRNYFLHNNTIIELDFIIPEEDLQSSIDIINKIVASYNFVTPAQ